MFYEGDANTGQSDLEGGGSSLGNWLEGITYPVINESPLSLNLNIWAPLGFPTLNIIRPSDKQIVADTWNILTLDGQVAAIESATDINLSGVSVSEISSEANVVIYPNPTSNSLNIELIDLNEITTITIINLLGEIIITHTSSDKVMKLDLSELENGNYFVHLKSKNLDTIRKVSILK